MGDFDQKDVIRTYSDFDDEDVIGAEKKTVAPPASSDFAPEDVIDTAPQSDFDAADVVSTSREPDQKPTGRAGMLTDTDLAAIAAKHNVSVDELRDIAPYYGATREPESIGASLEQGAKHVVGSVGRGAFNLPQFAYKKAQSPQMRAALDELQAIGEGQRGIPQTLAEGLLIPGSLAAKAAQQFKVADTATRTAKVAAELAGAGARVAEATAMGATQGLGSSREGQELESAYSGAFWGGLLGSGAEVLGGALKLRGKKRPSDIPSHAEADITEGAAEVGRRNAQSDQLIQESTIGNRTSLTPQEAETLIKQQLGEESLAKYLDPGTVEGRLIREKISPNGGSVTDDMIRSRLSDDILETRIRNLAGDIEGRSAAEALPTLEDAQAIIQKTADRQGVDYLGQRYSQYNELENARKYIQEKGIQAVRQPNFFGKAVNFASDNQFVLRWIDDRFGTKLEPTLSQLNKTYNRSTYALRQFRERQDDIFRQARKLGVDDAVNNGDKIYRALDTGNMNELSQEEKTVADMFKSYFEEVRQWSNKLGSEVDKMITPMNIPAVKNYVPHNMKPTQEIVGLLEKKIETAVNTELPQLLGRPISELTDLSRGELTVAMKSPAVKDLTATLELFDNKPIRDGADLSQRLKRFMYSHDERGSALETVARAALERTGKIPEFLLEKNLYALADMYSANMMRHLYLRKGIDQLRYQAKALDKAGATVDAQYVKNLISDIMGTRKGTAASAFMETRISANREIDKLIDKVGTDSVAGGALAGAKAIPDVLRQMTLNIYPNMLGWSARAGLQNLTGAISKLAPELGTKYGYTTTLRGAAYTVANLRRLMAEAKTAGHIPSEFTRKGEQAIAEGIRRSTPWRLTNEALDGLGKVGMQWFNLTESANRALTMGIGEMMARDLGRGSKLAQESLKNFPTTLRKQIDAAQSEKEVSQLLSKYLNDVTQYNYNRISLSEFGRTMGPIFSAFSKWPTATIGDIMYEMRSKGVLKSIPRNAEKYLAPLLMLQGVDMLLGEKLREGKFLPSTDKDSLSDRQKKLMGSGGLSQTAPIGSVGGVLSGEIFTPPAVDAAIQTFVVPLMQGDESKSAKGFGQMLQNFAPGAGLLRFLTDDVVTFATGHRPEGTNFIERTGSGADQIRRQLK